MALLLGTAYGLCLAAGLTMVGVLAAPTARGALTGTFYACAYLGFGVPLLLSVAGGEAGFSDTAGRARGAHRDRRRRAGAAGRPPPGRPDRGLISGLISGLTGPDS